MKTLAIIAAILVVAIVAGQGPVLSAAAGAAQSGLVKLMSGGTQTGDEQDGDPEDSSGEP